VVVLLRQTFLAKRVTGIIQFFHRLLLLVAAVAVRNQIATLAHKMVAMVALAVVVELLWGRQTKALVELETPRPLHQAKATMAQLVKLITQHFVSVAAVVVLVQ
jgi:hypothetical protein